MDPRDFPPPDLVSVRDAATYANVDVDTIYNAIHRQEIRCWGPPNRYRVSLSEVLPVWGKMPSTGVRQQITKRWNRNRVAWAKSKGVPAQLDRPIPALGSDSQS